MELSVAVKLIQNGVSQVAHPCTWADLGAGGGLFTQALGSILPEGSLIYAIDKDITSLNKIKFSERSIIKRLQADFSADDLSLANLDGVIMANSLHYIKEQASFMKNLKKMLKDSGKFILVEYDMSIGNRWVPYPISKSLLKTLAKQAGYSVVDFMEEEPSVLNSTTIYSAAFPLIG